MLIYARNQIFCSKAVNKAPKILIFCGILSNYTWKMPVSKLLSHVFYCFMNFLCTEASILGGGGGGGKHIILPPNNFANLKNSYLMQE